MVLKQSVYEKGRINTRFFHFLFRVQNNKPPKAAKYLLLIMSVNLRRQFVKEITERDYRGRMALGGEKGGK